METREQKINRLLKRLKEFKKTKPDYEPTPEEIEESKKVKVHAD